eukprot:1292275-Amorphochlora_amoeboformis.AAC.1
MFEISSLCLHPDPPRIERDRFHAGMCTASVRLFRFVHTVLKHNTEFAVGTLRSRVLIDEFYALLFEAMFSPEVDPSNPNPNPNPADPNPNPNTTLLTQTLTWTQLTQP